MVRIKEAIVVEGRYDKNTLSQVVDAAIFETSGFHIMNDKSQLELLRKVAQRSGLIVFTDSDGAGFLIRNHLKSTIDPQFLKHAYIPDIAGKERRKSAPGKEGKLGVEGMTPEIILQCLRRAGATFEGEVAQKTYAISKQDLVSLGLSGCADSSAKRRALLKRMNLPEHMSCNAMLQALNLLLSLDELKVLLERNHD